MNVPSSRQMRRWQRVIIGIDPGTNVMGYGVLGLASRTPEVIDLGAIKFKATESHYLRLRRIHESVLRLVEQFLPDEMAIEAPFFGKNVQSMLKLGRAQGVAMVAALSRDVPITEYEPRKIKMAITGNGAGAGNAAPHPQDRTRGTPRRARCIRRPRRGPHPLLRERTTPKDRRTTFLERIHRAQPRQSAIAFHIILANFPLHAINNQSAASDSGKKL